jgi:peptide deformylase
MAIRKVLQIGDEFLKAENATVDDFKSKGIQRIIQGLVRDLTDTMRKADLIGMASPQIGRNFKVFITEVRKTKARELDQTDELRIYINPKIITYSKDECEIYEGCGSVLKGKLFGPVLRPSKITIQAQSLDGALFKLTCDGILARVIQHEYDHMSGVEFLEKISDYKKIMSREHYLKKIKTSKAQIERSRISIIDFTQCKESD